ncbi:MAG: glycosyltransferase [Phycisphaerales bacterium]|nr:glycosyltransferase [Phycisphaerales bacterium]
MKENKLVSIVVICYNHASFIEECLGSVLKQKYTNWELIIADDASTDNSVALIQNWINTTGVNVTTNFHQKNTGVGTVLNECLALSTGNYLKFIAADDVLHPELIEKAVNFFEHASNDYGVVFSNAQYINEKSEVQAKTIIPQGKTIPTGWIRTALPLSNFIPAPAVVIKKEVYQKIGNYNPDIQIDDYDCWLRASISFQFHYIDEPLVYYRIHGNNISHSIDFSNDMIELLIKNDIEGDFASEIKLKIQDQYYLGKKNIPVMSSYSRYQYRDKWLSFCISNGLPYYMFRVFDKFFK